MIDALALNAVFFAGGVFAFLKLLQGARRHGFADPDRRIRSYGAKRILRRMSGCRVSSGLRGVTGCHVCGMAGRVRRFANQRQNDNEKLADILTR